MSPKAFSCDDSKITEFEMIDTPNTSTAYYVMGLDQNMRMVI